MKKQISFLLLFVLVISLVFTACGQDDSSSSGKYSIYELDVNGTSVVKVKYTPSSDDVETQIQEMLQRLQTSADDAEYQQTIPSSVEVQSTSLNDGVLTVDFSTGYKDLSDTTEPLVRAAVVTTLCQIDGVDSVIFTVDGVPLTDDSDVQIGAMTKQSFIIDFTNRVKMDQTTKLTLYYASKDGNSLIKETREVEYNSNTPLAKVVLSELTKDPETDGAHAAISTDVNVTSYALSDGICYLTLDAGIQNQSINVSDEIAIYAIVNSLVELDNINKVQITVEGENDTTVSVSSQLSGLYEKNMEIVNTTTEEGANEE